MASSSNSANPWHALAGSGILVTHTGLRLTLQRMAASKPTSKQHLLVELDRADLGGLRTLLAVLDLELHLLALGQAAEALGRDGGVVAEHVLAAVLGGDEAEALRVVEPLHGTGHVRLSEGVLAPLVVHCLSDSGSGQLQCRLRI